MKIARVYTRRIMGTTRSAPLAEAAAAMQRFRVGTLLVMEDPPAFGPPIGIVTDRDIALQGFASEASTVGAVMTPVVATVAETADTHEALELMRAHGVRRLVVVNGDGGLCGVLSIDDIVDGLSADLAEAALVLKGEFRREAAGVGGVNVGV